MIGKLNGKKNDVYLRYRFCIFINYVEIKVCKVIISKGFVKFGFVLV